MLGLMSVLILKILVRFTKVMCLRWNISFLLLMEEAWFVVRRMMSILDLFLVSILSRLNNSIEIGKEKENRKQNLKNYVKCVTMYVRCFL